MRIDWSKTRIFIRPGATDMRKQINTLSVFISEYLKLDPLCGDIYIFCGRDRKRIKIIYWDRNGFCLWQKRLEKDKFPWPANDEEVRQITSDELFMILDGIDFFHAHKILKYSAVS